MKKIIIHFLHANNMDVCMNYNVVFVKMTDGSERYFKSKEIKNKKKITRNGVEHKLTNLISQMIIAKQFTYSTLDHIIYLNFNNIIKLGCKEYFPINEEDVVNVSGDSAKVVKILTNKIKYLEHTIGWANKLSDRCFEDDLWKLYEEFEW